VIEGDERAHTLVLTKEGREVRRVPIRLVPGDVRVIEP
jgi:hypothetical protein